MRKRKGQFIVDESGNKTAVILEIDHYSQLLDAQEELALIRAFDEAKASEDDLIRFTQAVKEIEGL